MMSDFSARVRLAMGFSVAHVVAAMDDPCSFVFLKFPHACMFSAPRGVRLSGSITWVLTFAFRQRDQVATLFGHFFCGVCKDCATYHQFSVARFLVGHLFLFC